MRFPQAPNPAVHPALWKQTNVACGAMPRSGGCAVSVETASGLFNDSKLLNDSKPLNDTEPGTSQARKR